MTHTNSPQPSLFGGLRGAGDLVRRNARLFGSAEALVFGDVRLTWREVNARINRFAHELRRLGIGRGDRVALYGRNSHQWVEALFAVAKLGGVAVTVNHRLAPPEVEQIVADSGARALVCGAQESDAARGVASRARDVRAIIVIGAGAKDLENYEAMVARGDESEPVLERPIAADDPLLLLYTSGTTGFPKGAIYTHASTLIGMFVHVHAIGSRRTHRVMLPSPLHSAAGIAGIFCAVYVGSFIALINFDVATALRTIECEQITFTNLVPTTIQLLLEDPASERTDLASLQTLLYGGAPMPEPLVRRAMQRLPHCGFRQTFATTETGCAGTVLEPMEHRLALSAPRYVKLLRSCGRAQVNVEVAIVGAGWRELPPGEIGEIAVRTEANMVGYWNNPGATAAVLRDGWVRTGDMAYMDEDGYFYLVDRKNDMIVTGALNVYPSEVERVLHKHPAVADCAVFGLPDRKWGEAVAAAIVRRPNVEASAEELIAFCEGKIAGFKKPRRICFVEQIPRTPTGKILRRALRERFAQGPDETA